MVTVDSDPANHHERTTRTVLFVDVVESTRLIERDEDDAITRWRNLVKTVKTHILPNNDGRLVNSLGDGLLLEFSDARSGVSAAFEIQQASKNANGGLPPDRQMLLRMGIEVSDVIIGQHDVYGRGVMLGARLMTLAGPGEIVTSANVHDQLTPTLDAESEDLGECFVKHVKHPVRAYRIGPPGPRPVVEPGISLDNLLPTIAVVPFTSRDEAPDHHALGEVLAEEIIREISRSPYMSVISRLSTTVFRGREISVEEIGVHLNANHILSGVYRVHNQQIVLDLELAEASSAQIVWSERLKGQVSGLLCGEQELIRYAVTGVAGAIMSHELRRAHSHALPTLESYTLLIAAITHMHRLSLRDYETARRLLQTVIERAPRQAIPQAWLAKWHVLRVPQGWSSDRQKDIRLALDCTKRALDTDPYCTLALSVDGWIHTSLLKQFDVAQDCYDLAIQTNPNDSLAWLLKGALHAFKGEGQQAVEDTQRARKLSPLDPQRYFYDSLAATAYLGAGQYDHALELAQRSLRANRTHTSTLRAMAIAQWQLGQQQDARETVKELLRLQPKLTIANYLERHPAAECSTGKEWAKALQQAGVPH